jgi:glutathione S-transferase
MKLLYAPQSPFSRKVRAAAIELGLGDRIEVEYAEVMPGKPNRSYGGSVNPLRKIPALLPGDGAAIFDSTVICEYLDALAGGGVIIPREPAARWRVLTHHALAQGICEAAILVRYETWLRPESCRWTVWIDDQWDKVNSGLAWFERNQSALQEPVNLAHLALGSALGYIDFRWPTDNWRERFGTLARWFERMEQRPSFALTRPAQPPSA